MVGAIAGHCICIVLLFYGGMASANAGKVGDVHAVGWTMLGAAVLCH